MYFDSEQRVGRLHVLLLKELLNRDYKKMKGPRLVNLQTHLCWNWNIFCISAVPQYFWSHLLQIHPREEEESSKRWCLLDTGFTSEHGGPTLTFQRDMRNITCIWSQIRPSYSIGVSQFAYLCTILHTFCFVVEVCSHWKFQKEHMHFKCLNDALN